MTWFENIVELSLTLAHLDILQVDDLAVDVLRRDHAQLLAIHEHVGKLLSEKGVKKDARSGAQYAFRDFCFFFFFLIMIIAPGRRRGAGGLCGKPSVGFPA